MKTLITHYSKAQPVKLVSDLPTLTEQKHAHDLEIKNMTKSGFRYSTGEPVFDDISQIPQLDALLHNRRRLHNLFMALPKHAKDELGNIDNFVAALIKGDTDELMNLEVLLPSQEFLDSKKHSQLLSLIGDDPSLEVVDGKIVKKYEPSEPTA